MKQGILIYMVFTFISITAQEIEPDAFRTFEREFQRETSAHDFYSNQGLRSPYFSYFLPEEFLDLLSTERDVVMGISDACTDTAQALQQALWRAHVQAALAEGSILQSKSDFFTRELRAGGVANKHILLSYLTKNVLTRTPRIEFLKSYRTAYDETIVVARVLNDVGDTDPQIQASGELFISETTRDNEVQLDYRISFVSGPRNEKLPLDTINYRISDNRFSLYSAYQSKKSDEITMLRKYALPVEPLLTDKELIEAGFSKVTLLHGFWAGYMHALLLQLRRASEDNMRSRKMNEVKNQKVTNLGNELTRTNIMFTMDSLTILNNYLYLKVAITSEEVH